MITPPIAMASFAAASIAQASQLKTSVEGFRFGWIAYLLPFLFIYKPGLLMNGSPLDIAYVFVSSVVALVLVTGGIVGYMRGPLGLGARLVAVVVGLAMIAPLDQLWNYAFEVAVSAGGALLLVALLMLPGPADRAVVEPAKTTA